MSGGCQAHPLRPARYRCDGCGRLLCDGCVDEGHRLLICVHCGERALPLVSAGPTNVRERREAQQDAVNAAYGWPDMLRYCLRSEGRWIFGYTVALCAVFQYFLLAAMLAPMSQKLLPVTLAALVLVLLVWIVAPQLVLAVRSTYRGHNEMPSWAAAHDIPARSREVTTLFLALLAGAAPSAFVLWLLDCLPGGDGSSLLCTVALLATLPVSVAMVCLGFAAFAEFETRWMVVRLDLHARFLIAAGGDAWATVGAILLGAALVVVVRAAVGSVPLMVLVPYLLYTGSHALGVLFRRHRRTVERIYGLEGEAA